MVKPNCRLINFYQGVKEFVDFGRTLADEIIANRGEMLRLNFLRIANIPET